MKPCDSACGKGIKIIGKTQTVKFKSTKKYVLSEYIANPHLINGLKYDLRIYVVVTCFEPLKIYLFKEGLVRFATQKYTTNAKSLDTQFIHLTNYSVNKKADCYVKNNGEEEEEDASKWSLLQLSNWMNSNSIDYNKVMNRIKDVVIKTCISCEPHITSTYQR